MMKKSFLQDSQTKQIKDNKLFQQCMKILTSSTIQQNNKWLAENKIKSYTLRNDKAGEIVNTVNYLFQKVLIAGNIPLQYGMSQSQQQQQNILLAYLLAYYVPKSSSKKCIQFCHLLKHFSLWDYQFQYFYDVSLGQGLQKIGLYLQCRNHIIQSPVNKYKKSMISGVLAQIQQWSKLAQNIFKAYDQRTVIQQFVQVVKLHYLQVKKSQNQIVNGAEFFKICQIMGQRLIAKDERQTQGKGNSNHKVTSKIARRDNEVTVGQAFKQSLLNGLTMQDRQLIRILSCKDKNITRLLQDKHNKMVNMIGEEVDSLRQDIEIEKRKYLQVIEQKKSLAYFVQKIKRKTLQYVVQNNVRNEEELLQALDGYNKKYNPHAGDVNKCRKDIQEKRLLEVIQEQERMM